MRVPFNSHNSLVDQLARINAEQYKAQRELASGQRVHKASDDPLAMGRALELNSEKARLQTYDRNLRRARSIVEFSMDTLEQLKQVTGRAGDIANGADSLTTSADFRGKARETDQLLEQAVRMGNARFAGDHVFAGGNGAESPYVVHRYEEGDPLLDGDGNPRLDEQGDPLLAGPDEAGRISRVEYAGTTGAAEDTGFRIGEGHEIKPFQRGAANADMADFFNEMIALREALEAEDLDAVRETRPGMETAEDGIVAGMVDLGVSLRGIELTEKLNAKRFEQAERATSRELDADLVETITRLNQLQTGYQAALEGTSRMLDLSLLDYIR